MSTPAADIRDVWLSFRGRVVLEAVTLAVAEGDFLAVIGPNGGGKTMLLRVMLGLIRPDRGVVKLFGRPPRRARGLVGYVPQHPQFDAGYPIHALDVVRMGRLAAGRGRPADDIDRAHAALEQVQAGDLADRPIGKLSGGQLQRVLVARALAVEPRLLVMDEPTASLDPSVGLDLYELLAGLTPQMTIIVVSHDVGVISQHVRSVACVNRRVHFHPAGQITRDMMEATYGCSHDLLVHEHTHRVLPEHEPGGSAS